MSIAAAIVTKLVQTSLVGKLCELRAAQTPLPPVRPVIEIPSRVERFWFAVGRTVRNIKQQARLVRQRAGA